MLEIKKLLVLDKNKYYETHLSIINCIVPNKLTPKEVEVLAAFMSLEDDTIIDTKGQVIQHKFTTKNRKRVMEICNLQPQGLSNHLKSLVDKGFLIENDNKTITILPILLPESEEQYYRFKLVNQN